MYHYKQQETYVDYDIKYYFGDVITLIHVQYIYNQDSVRDLMELTKEYIEGQYLLNYSIYTQNIFNL